MDLFAHSLWTGAIYNRSKRIWRAVFFGVMPDLFSFGVFIAVFVLQNGFTQPDFSRTEPPDPLLVPQYVQGLYNITHSLLVFLAVFLLSSWMAKRVNWEMTAWAMHILIDIPTHSYEFFPTPFLWPLSEFKVNGVQWGQAWFMILNYSAIVIVYALLFYRKKKHKRSVYDYSGNRT